MVALVAAASAPGAAEEALRGRNHAWLLATLPEGALLEVQVVHGGEAWWEAWTAERYAAFRAGVAAAMGRDYAAPAQGPEGLPPGTGDQRYVCDVWIDAWGTTRFNVMVPRGLPRSLPMDGGGCWIYGGSQATTFVAENANQCIVVQGFRVCSNSYDWLLRSGSEHGDSWWAGTGLMWVFPPPFGSVVFLNGVELADDL